jgi:putative ABC transport system permease protein
VKTRDVFSYSYGSIKLRKLRSGLTTLGIVIGIAAIIALMSFTQGFEASITNQFSEGFATDTVTVTSQNPLRFPGAGQPSDFELHVNDTDAIENLELVESATPVVTKQVDLNSSDIEMSMTVSGIEYDTYASVYTTLFVAGSGMIPASTDNNTIVIGQTVHDPWGNGTIFAGVGDDITLTVTIFDNGAFHENNVTLTVVAILEEIGQSFGGPSDTGIYIPLDLAVELFETEEANGIIVQLVDDSDATIEAATTAIEELFDGEAYVLTATAVLDTISSALDTVELLLGGIAGISLLVAGVGIMNIMIVSLMERTREIGILKAVGAKSRSILAVFLSEALIIGLLGGIIGIAAGYVIAIFLSGFLSGGTGFFGAGPGGGSTGPTLTSITPVITPDLILMALFFGMVVSVVFGLYPAWRASRLKPVDALRHE